MLSLQKIYETSYRSKTALLSPCSGYPSAFPNDNILTAPNLKFICLKMTHPKMITNEHDVNDRVQKRIWKRRKS